jgi:hypothetical protein
MLDPSGVRPSAHRHIEHLGAAGQVTDDEGAEIRATSHPLTTRCPIPTNEPISDETRTSASGA